MSVKKKMTDIANAIRTITLKEDPLGLDGMITDLAAIMEYSLADIEGQLSDMTLDKKLTVMADIIRHGAAFTNTKKLSLDEMARVITEFPNAVVSDGKAFFDTLDAAIAACEDGGTVTLLKDVDVGDLSNISIDKSITLDGRSHTITRKTESGNLFVITKDGVTFNIQNVIADVSLASGASFLYGNNITADVNISDSDITSTENVLFLRSSACNVTVNSSTLNAGLRNIQFNYCLGNVEVNHSNLYGGRSDANAFLIFDSEVDVCIKSSNLYGRNSPALSVRYSDVSVLIDDSYVQADNTIYGAIDVHNCSPLIDLKGSTKVWVDALTHASIRMRGSQNCDPIITLYDNVTLTDGVRSPIYYTTYAYRTGFHVKFAKDYQGAKYMVMSTTDSTLNCQIWLEISLDAAYSHLSGIVDVFAFDENAADEAKDRGFTVKVDNALGCYAILEGHAGHCYWTEDDIEIEAKTKITWEEGSTVNIESVEVTSCKYIINDSEFVEDENLEIFYGWFLNGSSVADGKIFRGDIYPLSANDAIELEIRVSGSLSDNQGCLSYVEKTLHQVVRSGSHQT